MIHHRDDIASKMGMWFFLFSEMLFFSGIFIVYAVMRAKYKVDFEIGSSQLNVFIGTVNTVILVISSACITMAITAIKEGKQILAKRLTAATLILGVIFMINKYFEWHHKIDLNIYPSSELVMSLQQGQTIFFGLYYFMTGLHAVHIIVGLLLLTIVYFKISKNSITSQHYTLLENTSLYWHLVDLIWIFLFPLLYLIN